MTFHRRHPSRSEGPFVDASRRARVWAGRADRPACSLWPLSQGLPAAPRARFASAPGSGEAVTGSSAERFRRRVARRSKPMPGGAERGRLFRKQKIKLILSGKKILRFRIAAQFAGMATDDAGGSGGGCGALQGRSIGKGVKPDAAVGLHLYAVLRLDTYASGATASGTTSRRSRW